MIGLAVTGEDFELDFTVWSDRNNCTAADIVPGRGRKIYGVLYEISDVLLSRETAGARKSLDAIEGRRYQRHSVQVYKADNPANPVLAWTYTAIESERRKGIKTSMAYARHILLGLRERGAPEEYISYVKERIINNNPDLRTPMEELLSHA